MKKKSGHRRRTKMVRRSRKNLRRTIKRKSLGKGRRRPTRRYSRIQRGGMFIDGVTPEERITNLTNLADSGNVEAQRELGILFYHGIGLEKDYGEAMKYFNLAAEQGDELAQYYLGNMFREGNGVDQNDAKAFEWYKRASDKGYIPAKQKIRKHYAAAAAAAASKDKLQKLDELQKQFHLDNYENVIDKHHMPIPKLLYIPNG